MKIYGQIERVTNLHNKVAKGKKQKHWRKSLCLDQVYGLPDRLHCWIPYHECMKEFYSEPLKQKHWVVVEGEEEVYTDSKGITKVSIVPTKIKYI